MQENTSVVTFVSSIFFAFFLRNIKECHCCIELKGCDQGMRSEEVITDQKADGIENGKIITQHPELSCLCLQKWNLKQAAVNCKTKNKRKFCHLGTQDRLKIYLVYTLACGESNILTLSLMSFLTLSTTEG